MTEQMRRRRALMGAQTGASSDVLFEWVPSDGISMFNITATTGATARYELRSDALRIQPATGSWKGTFVALLSQLTWDGDFTVEVEVSAQNGANANLYVFAYSINGMKIRLQKQASQFNNKLYIRNTDSSAEKSVTPSGQTLPYTLRLYVNKTNGSYGQIVTNGNSFVTNTVATPTAKSTSMLLLGVDGQEQTYYYDISHIKITKGASAIS